MHRSMILMVVLASTALFAACSSPVTKSEKPHATINIKSLLVLNFPSSTLEPQYYDSFLASLATQLHRKYGVRVTAGVSVGRGVWGQLNHLRKNACRIFKDDIDKASHAFNGLRIGKSLQLSEHALSLWNMCCAEQDDTKPLIDLFTTYGLALLSRERTEDAMAAFRQVAALAPFGQPQDMGLSDEQHQAISLAYKQELSGNPTQVNIVSEPQGAQVIVDGKKRGQTPLSTVNLFPGRHCIRLETKGRGTWTSSLAAGVPPALIQAWLTPAWKGSAPHALWKMAKDMNQPEDDESQELEEAAKLFHTDAVLLIRLDKTDNTLQLNSLLFVPGIGVTHPWEEFDLGPEGKGLLKKLSRAVTTFSELKPKISKVKHSKKRPKKKKSKKRKEKRKKKRKK